MSHQLTRRKHSCAGECSRTPTRSLYTDACRDSSTPQSSECANRDLLASKENAPSIIQAILREVGECRSQDLSVKLPPVSTGVNYAIFYPRHGLLPLYTFNEANLTRAHFIKLSRRQKTPIPRFRNKAHLTSPSYLGLGLSQTKKCIACYLLFQSLSTHSTQMSEKRLSACLLRAGYTFTDSIVGGRVTRVHTVHWKDEWSTIPWRSLLR